MWPFKRKPSLTPTIERWRIPNECQEEFCRLYDEMLNTEGSRRLPVLRFWRYLGTIVPTRLCDRPVQVVFDSHIPHLAFELAPDTQENKQ